MCLSPRPHQKPQVLIYYVLMYLGVLIQITLALEADARLKLSTGREKTRKLLRENVKPGGLHFQSAGHLSCHS